MKGKYGKLQWLAAKFKLDNVIAVLDRNKIQQDGFSDDIMPLNPVKEKWLSFNWDVIEVNGHRIEQLSACF